MQRVVNDMHAAERQLSRRRRSKQMHPFRVGTAVPISLLGTATRIAREGAEMPRARKAATSKRQSATTTGRETSTKRQGTATRASTTRTRSTATAASGSLACPECGKAFTRAASLGAHRNRAHGVVGASSRSSAARSSTARAASRARGRGAGVNRDALLSNLFPNGIPAKESVIREVNEWLDQAERLASLA